MISLWSLQRRASALQSHIPYYDAACLFIISSLIPFVWHVNTDNFFYEENPIQWAFSQNLELKASDIYIYVENPKWWFRALVSRAFLIFRTGSSYINQDSIKSKGILHSSDPCLATTCWSSNLSTVPIHLTKRIYEEAGLLALVIAFSYSSAYWSADVFQLRSICIAFLTSSCHQSRLST